MTTTLLIMKTGRVDTPKGPVTATLDMENDMPHVTFEGATGRHRILVSETVGGFERAAAHAEGFVAWYGIEWSAAKGLGLELVRQVMDQPPAKAPAPAGKRVTFEFFQTPSTGYVSVVALVDGKRRDVVRAGIGRIGVDGERSDWVRVRRSRPPGEGADRGGRRRPRAAHAEDLEEGVNLAELEAATSTVVAEVDLVARRLARRLVMARDTWDRIVKLTARMNAKRGPAEALAPADVAAALLAVGVEKLKR